MDTNNLDQLVAWKVGMSLDNADQAKKIEVVRAAILEDISERYPWSFLERKTETISLSSGDREKTLPKDFQRLISVALIDSDNVVYPIHPAQPSEVEEENPDLDDTDRPYRRWLEWDSVTQRPQVVLDPKCDASYTLRLRYQKKLMPNQVLLVPNGLIAFWGMVVVLTKVEKSDVIKKYSDLYEFGIQRMWASDMPDLNYAGDQKVALSIERFNQDMDGIHG